MDKVLSANSRSYVKEDYGYYGDNATDNIAALQERRSNFMEALENVQFDKDKGTTFTIAEYGAADGSVSMPFFSAFIERIKEKYGAEQSVQVYYEDQPLNDYNSLFARLHGIKDGQESFLRRYDKVYTFACATNFYEQCFPDNTVHIGISTISTHWLHRRPCNLKSAIFHVLSTDCQEKSAFTNQARDDWKRFLLLRAQELAPGGQLLIVALAGRVGDEDHENRKKNISIRGQTKENLTKHWKQMVDEGIITQEEFYNTNFITYYRTEAELMEPFNDPCPEIYKAGLRVVSVRAYDIEDRHFHAFCNSKTEDESTRREYARTFIGSVRRWASHTFISSLGNNRSKKEKTEIVEELYTRYTEDVVENPKAHFKSPYHVYLHLCKIPSG